MTCDRFEKFKSGAVEPGEFDRHAERCSECRDQAALDARLDRDIAALRAPVDDRGLWEKIETALEHEKRTSDVRPFFRRRWLALAPAGAALIVLAVLGIQALKRPSVQPDLLSRQALARVEKTEKEYLGAIQALERRATPKLASMDIQMMSLYRDKLAIVDSQIDKCREALDSNPGNAHIRRYLLAALQDKRQTLADLLGTNQIEQ